MNGTATTIGCPEARMPASPSTVRTTCPYCGVGCGVLAIADGSGGAAIKGDPRHPANAGRLCSKGSALGETLGLETRLLHPQIGPKRVTWEAALDHVAQRLIDIRAEHGPEAIAFYLSGQLLTEDYYVANKLAKGFIGTPHVDTNSRLCMASSVAGHRRAFGADVVPQCYDDLEIADLVVLAGSNTAWCHPILYQRIQVARGERGMRVVNIDPRRTATSEGSDLQLSLRPGSDAALWCGLLVHLHDSGCIDVNFIARHTQGYEDALAAARNLAPDAATVASATGLEVHQIELFWRWWETSRNVVSCYSQGVNQSIAGTDKVNAIINCHLATGRIGKPGCGPLSLTGQPNAMGGREVGGLANMLAAHMGFSAPERDLVARFWNAPAVVAHEGLKAVQMFEAIAEGRIKALWIMGTNPAVSLPRSTITRAALDRLDLLVVAENVASNDTLRHAHVRLPAHAWGEKDGTVTNSERRISRQRRFLEPADEARADWWILSQVAARMGWQGAFGYDTPAAVFREHARLSACENDGRRAFDIGGLADLTDAEYADLEPVQWPVLRGGKGRERMFADGRFYTPGGRGRFVAVTAPPAIDVREAWPFVLNTGRIRDQWHTMTRTGLSPRLLTHIGEPYVEVHPQDAARLGLEQGTIARVRTCHGEALLRVLVSRNQQTGSLFAPIHWSDENSAGGGIGRLVHGDCDPVSGQPDSKATPASIEPAGLTHFGFLLSRARPTVAGLPYWTLAPMAAGHVLYFAMSSGGGEWDPRTTAMLPSGERLMLVDDALGIHRAAVLREGRLEAVLYCGIGPKLPSPDWLKSCFALDPMSAADRRALLAGRPAASQDDEGAIVCVCFQVGALRIEAAIRDGALTSEAVGAACGAGTNCGSCIPELRRMLRSREPAHA